MHCTAATIKSTLLVGNCGAPAISVYPGVYQSAIGVLQSQHPCGLQPDFGEQVQNLE